MTGVQTCALPIFSTAETADTVFVFDDGRIVERGTHAELVAAGGRYASLYASWLGNVRA